MSSKIILEDLKIYAYHGVLPEERILGTWYILNVEVHADLWEAAASDALKDTLNYAQINDLVHEEMEIPSDLLEHVAGRIISRLEAQFPEVSEVNIRITKTRPPMRGEMKGVSLELHKKR